MTDTAPGIQRRPDDWEPASHDRADSQAGGGWRGPERMSEYARLRETCPVAWAGDWGGYWTLSRYGDIRQAATKHETFRSGQLFVQVPQPEPVIPISLNPPAHTTYRRALNKYFSSERMSELEPVVRAHVNRMLGPILERGSAQMITEFCGPVPALALASLLNMPDDAWRELVRVQAAVEAVSQTAESKDAIGERSFAILAQHVARLVEQRRKQPLDEHRDLISGVLAMTVEGEPLDDATVTGIGVMLIGAGHGTTRDGLASSLCMLAMQAGDQARLRSDRSLIPSAIEEFLRLEPPVQEAGRSAAHDVDLHDRTIGHGEHVAFNLAAGNRDPDAYEHPDACIIDREPNKHLSFGHGVHKCLGAPLGRLVIRVALEEILERSRSFELDGAPAPAPGLYLGGYASLPLRFNVA